MTFLTCGNEDPPGEGLHPVADGSHCYRVVPPRLKLIVIVMIMLTIKREIRVMVMVVVMTIMNSRGGHDDDGDEKFWC